MKFSKRLTLLREQRKLSQTELAQKTGIHLSRINRIEAGKIENPGLNSLIKLANALDTTLDNLAGRVEFTTRRISKARVQLLPDFEELYLLQQSFSNEQRNMVLKFAQFIAQQSASQ